MPLLNDESLRTLLHESGNSFAIPPSGAADTLDRVRRGDDERAAPVQTAFDLGDGDAVPAARTIRGTLRAHRVLTVAAALIILLALGGAGILWGNTAPPPRSTAGGAVLHGGAPQPAPRTSSGQFGLKTTGTGAPYGAASVPAATPSSAAGTATSGTSSTNAPALPTGAVGQPARIEQTGSLDLTVARGRLSATMTRLADLATTFDGFVANSQTQSGGPGAPSGTVTLQIPVATFPAVLKEAQSLGHTSQLTTKATDVTGQYVDLQARITALEASRQQYLTIMTRASSIGDVLAVQAQLDSLQSQIEQLQGQLGLLTSETTYATLISTVSEAGPAHHRPAPAARSAWSRAWHDSLHGFAAGVEGLIRVAGPVLFALLCLAAVLLGGRLSWRRLQRRNL
jgi:hypothetical protein